MLVQYKYENAIFGDLIVHIHSFRLSIPLTKI